MRSLELRVPPPLVFLLVGAGMWIAEARGDFAATFLSPRWIAAVCVGGAALLVGLSATSRFKSAGTTLDPRAPERASAVVSDGIYRRTRNPMYLALALALTAWALHLGATWGWLGLPFFTAYMTLFQIMPEERALRTRFGEEYESYLGRVRRWI